MAKFDLTSKIGQYLDRHLVFPLLEFLSAKEVRHIIVRLELPQTYVNVLLESLRVLVFSCFTLKGHLK